VKLTVQGDTIEVDFEGAPPQLPPGRAQLYAQLRGLARDLSAQVQLTPNVRGNAGCYRGVHG